MDRKKLQELESRCVQEEAPQCVAACPIHVDARAFLARIAKGAWDEALEVLVASMPLPGIVGRICDHPCQLQCRRAEAGDGVAISHLEQAALRRARKRKGPILLPAKDRRVALVGGGLSGLVAAWDLLRKGFGVTILSQGERLGEALREFPEEVLPQSVIEEETGLLLEMGANVRVVQQIEGPAWIKALRSEFDAVYVASEGSEGLKPLAGVERLAIEPLTLSTAEAGLFVGRRDPAGAAPSPIEAVAEGRRAATSIDRYLQGVSLTAGREREGPYKTRLYTSLAGVTPKAVVPMGDRISGYSDAEGMEEAGRCIGCECMECVKACLFLDRFKSFPKRYVRQISNEATMVMGSHGQTIKLVNSCSLCGLCEVICPNDLSMAEVCMEARMSLASRGKLAPSAHDFALADMLSSNSDRAGVVLHEPGKEASKYAFFPGCQMAAIYPEHLRSTYEYLRGRLKGGTGLMLRCCGAPAEWAARADLFQEALADLRQDWVSLGKPIMILACPTCLQVFRRHVPKMEPIMLWEVLTESPEGGSPKKGKGKRLAIHDPCTARHEPAMQESIRALLARMGYAIEELPLSRERTECCGFGGLVSSANPPLAKDVARRRALESPTDYVTYCAMCRNALAASGKRTSHILDLFFSGSSPDPAGMKALGLSERSENRFRLKRTMLKTLWGKNEESMEEYERIELYVAEAVAAQMEERRILREDVQKVISRAERSGIRLYSPELQRYRASFRPDQVTYWVEYSAEGKGFRVHNAYYHRMEIVEESGS
ncbi:MAG: pyridine nucleotide-disulfide oxidoreductase/dicluster-binding protein [Syntrophorhabdales bacterium]|jgi:NADPH-dependent glutamate synthase beta subunit-like oxidoreductase